MRYNAQSAYITDRTSELQYTARILQKDRTSALIRTRAKKRQN